ncbi:MAG TPA: hypothetical protein PKA90_16290 [Ignavibacteria bacterium]|nr:hypothetical protein [Ignavibacteria bacterium]
MEVHHETSEPENGVKPWKHYLVEFFMLFLAVTAGFFAENLRDSFEEEKKAKEMAIGLYEELVQDSLQIHNAIIRQNLLKDEMSSLIKTLSDKDVENKITLLTYYEASYLLETDMVIPANANLKQLISSGRIRYFKNKELISDLSRWDNVISVQFMDRHETDQKRLIEEIKSVNRVFRPEITDSIRMYSFNNFLNNKELDTGNRARFENTKESLLTYNISDLSEVTGWASERRKNAIVRSELFLPLQLSHIRTILKDFNEEFDMNR